MSKEHEQYILDGKFCPKCGAKQQVEFYLDDQKYEDFYISCTNCFWIQRPEVERGFIDRFLEQYIKELKEKGERK